MKLLLFHPTIIRTARSIYYCGLGYGADTTRFTERISSPLIKLSLRFECTQLSYVQLFLKSCNTNSIDTFNETRNPYKLNYTVSQKGPTFKLSAALSNLNRFSKFLHYWKAHKIRYKTNTKLPTSP